MLAMTPRDTWQRASVSAVRNFWKPVEFAGAEPGRGFRTRVVADENNRREIVVSIVSDADAVPELVQGCRCKNACITSYRVAHCDRHQLRLVHSNVRPVGRFAYVLRRTHPCVADRLTRRPIETPIMQQQCMLPI